MLKKVFSVESGNFLMGVLIWVSSYVSNLGWLGESSAFSKIFLGCCILVYVFMLWFSLDNPEDEEEPKKFSRFLTGLFAVLNIIASIFVLFGGTEVKVSKTTLESTNIVESAVLSKKYVEYKEDSKKDNNEINWSLLYHSDSDKKENKFGKIADYTLTSKDGVKSYKGINTRLSADEGDVVTKYEKVKVVRKVVNLFGQVTQEDTIKAEVLK